MPWIYRVNIQCDKLKAIFTKSLMRRLWKSLIRPDCRICSTNLTKIRDKENHIVTTAGWEWIWPRPFKRMIAPFQRLKRRHSHQIRIWQAAFSKLAFDNRLWKPMRGYKNLNRFKIEQIKFWDARWWYSRWWEDAPCPLSTGPRVLGTLEPDDEYKENCELGKHSGKPKYKLSSELTLIERGGKMTSHMGAIIAFKHFKRSYSLWG